MTGSILAARRSPLCDRTEVEQLFSLLIRNHGPQTQGVPITTGICLPPRRICDADRLCVTDPNGMEVPTEASVTARWPDGSCKWILLSFVAPDLSTDASHWPVVRHQSRLAEARAPHVAELHDAGLQIDIGGESRTLTFPFEAGNGATSSPELRKVESTAGTVCTVSRFEGSVANGLNAAVTVHQWHNSPHVRLDLSLHNPNRAQHRGGLWDLGDPGSILFDRFGVSVAAAADQIGIDLGLSGLDWTSADSTDEVFVRQESSGGFAWQSTNHVDRNQALPFEVRGYRARTPHGDVTGDRVQPLVAIRSETGILAGTVAEFWQQFPTSARATADGLHLDLFPIAPGRQHELQAGERKTHSIWLSASASRPPRFSVTLPPEWIDGCNALPWFSAAAVDSDGRLQRFLAEALGPGRSWRDRREIIDEYGWRNFGDVHADHEQQYFDGEQPVVSHYNNQFDLIFGGILHYLRSGDPDWFDFLDLLARHVSDIDIYHTSRDRAVYNGGLFWHTDHYVDAGTATHRAYSRANAPGREPYGGGLSCEHNYTTGLLHHYYLTGNPHSRAAVLSLADWVLAMEDGTQTILSLVDDGPTGMASCTVFPDFHGPGRGPGNSVNALIDGWLLTSDRTYLDKAAELMRRVVHPQQDLDALHLGDSEGHWSYTVFLSALGRFLVLKQELAELDADYAYGRASMQHYGRWMSANEKPALSEPESLEFVTEAWAAQDFRKANVLRLCARYEVNPDNVAMMRARADEIANRAWEDLYSFDARYNARTLSILMTEGLRDIWHRDNPPITPAPEPEWTGGFGSWEMFRSQRDRVKQGLRNPVQLVSMMQRAIHPKRWLRFAHALHRQLGR